MPDLDVPKIGKYEVQAELGQGGFGKVYRAFDPTVGRSVAIKILTAEGNPDLLTRFRNEATAAGKLKHKNIVTIYEFGEYSGRPYLVMELLEGQDLVQVIKDGVRLSLLQKMNIMDQVADGLDCAHRNGIIHRDIKPGNIRLLPDGTVKIMDFGVARMNRERDETRLTQQGDLIGTILYMSPEQFSGGVADVLSDVFAYGVTYYELLTGQHPFKSTDPARVMFKISMEEPEPLRALAPDCPEGLEQIINRAIQKDREMRYQGLRDLRLDTEPLLFELQQERARTLVVEAQRLSNAGEFTNALTIIHEALDLDPGNRDVRQLRDVVQRELQKQALQSRLQVMLQTAEEQLARREFAPAVQTLESALKLDQTNTRTRASLEAARADLQRFKDSARLAALALVDLRKKDFAAAHEKASEAARLDSFNKEAEHVLAEVRKHSSILDRLREMDALRAQGEWDSCLRELRKLASSHPDSREVQNFLEETVARQAAARRIAAASMQAKEYLDRSRFGDAIECLSSALRDFPEEPGMLALLAQAEEGLDALRRTEAIEQAVSTAQSMQAAMDFDGALREVDRALLLFPGESRLAELSRAVSSARVDWERDLFVKGIVQQCDDLRANLQWSKALEAVQAGLRSYNQDPALLKLEAELRNLCERHQHADAARRSMEAGRLHEAVEGLETACNRDPEATELQSLLSRAKLELQAQRQAVERVARKAEARTEREDFQGALQILETALESWPGESRILELLQTIKEAQATKQRAHAVSAVVEECNQLRTNDRLAEALEVLQSGLQRYEGEPVLIELEKELREQLARKQWAEAISQYAAEAISRYVVEAQRLLGQSQTTRALEMLEKACTEYPEASELQALLVQARARRDGVDQAQIEAQGCAFKGDFTQALQILERASQSWPGEPRLEELAQTLIAARVAHEREQAIEKIVRESKRLGANQQYVDALRTVQEGLRQFEKEPALMQLEQELVRELQRQQQALAVEAALRKRTEALKQAVAECRRLFEEKQWQTAANALEKALEQFPGEAPLVQLLNEVREQLLAAQYREMVGKTCQEAEARLDLQDFDGVTQILEQALKSWPSEIRFRELLKRNQDALTWRAQARAAKIQQKIEESSRLLQDGQPQAAVNALERALQEFPEEEQLSRLLSAARQELLLAQRRKAIDVASQEATGRTDRRDFDGAIAILEQALKFWPGDERLTKLLDGTRRDHAAWERQRALEGIVQQVQQLAGQNRFAEALAAIQVGLQRYENEPTLTELRRSIVEREQQELERRAAMVRQEVESAENLLAQHKTQFAIEVLEKALEKFLNQEELVKLLARARTQLSTEQRQNVLDKAFHEAKGREEEQDFEGAMQVLERALKAYPGEKQITDRIAAVRGARERRERQRLVIEVSQQCEQLTAASRFAEALAIIRNGLQRYADEPTLLELQQRLREELDKQERHLVRQAEFEKLLAIERQIGAGLRRRKLNQLSEQARRIVDKYAADEDFASELARIQGRIASAIESRHQPKPIPWRWIAAGLGAITLITLTILFRLQPREKAAIPLIPLEIRSDPPGASIRLGDRSCTTPACRFDIAPGHYQVQASLEGYQPVEQTVVIETGKPAPTLALTLQPVRQAAAPTAAAVITGTLLVEAGLPDGLVFIDGVPRQRTDANGLVRLPIEPNTYRVSIQKNDYQTPPEQRVKIVSGVTRRIPFKLSPRPAKLELRGAPSGVEVRAGNSVLGRTDGSGVFSAPVPADTQNFQVVQGSASRQIRQQFSAGQTVAVEWKDVAPRIAPPPVTPPPVKTPPSVEALEAQEWEQVRNATDPAQVQNFLDKYKNGPHTTQAQALLDDLAWKATNRNDEGSLRGYVSRFPRGNHAADANPSLQNRAWTRKNNNDSQALRSFIEQNPNSVHKAEAQNRLDQLNPPAQAPAERAHANPQQAHPLQAQMQEIDNVLDSLSALLSQKKWRDVRKIWPDVSSDFEHNKDDVKLNRKAEAVIVGDSASVDCELVIQPRAGRQPPRIFGEKVTLRKNKDGHWFVANMTETNQ